MDKLSEARKRINDIDREMARLWAERMSAAADISDYKKEHGLPILDAGRESSLLENNLQYVPEELGGYYVDFLRGVISISKQFQHDRTVGDPSVVSLKLGDRSYDIHIRRGALKNAGGIMNLKRKVLIVTDDGVPEEYSKAVAEQCAEPYIVTLPHGEQTKCFDSFRLLLKEMLERGFTRGDCVVAVGGGVIGDLAGFAASAYMRGIDFYNIPTTTLSQIDSSIGGKVAIDLEGFKNTVGAFWQPKSVLVDPDVLKTLDPRQVSSGLAEAVKMSLCFDTDLFELFEQGNILENIDEIIRRSLIIKKNVVEQDEKEAGLRKVLNFGHTIGHGVETAAEGRLLHGECVALGMLPMCSPEVRARLLNVLKKLDLPTDIDVDIAEAEAAMLHDKKSENSGVTVVKVNTAGKYELEKISFNELFERLHSYLDEVRA